MPDKALSWNSICKGEVDGCLKPVLYADNPVKSAIIEQGKYVYRTGYICSAVSQPHTPHLSLVIDIIVILITTLRLRVTDLIFTCLLARCLGR